MRVPQLVEGDGAGQPRRDATPYVPQLTSALPRVALSALAGAANHCRGCDLYRHATQAVFGEGSVRAAIMIVGEQPGAEEDTSGSPFVGPAGEVLDAALAASGIDRRECYVTNMVKHFKWTSSPNGKRRLHARPSALEVAACRPWFDREVLLVKPKVVVLLGATAGQAVLGAAFRVTKSRGKVIRTAAIAPAVIATFHPSAVLRASGERGAAALRDALVHDLRVAKAVARRSGA